MASPGTDRDEDALGPMGTAGGALLTGAAVKGMGARRPSVHGRARSDVFGDALDLADPVSFFLASLHRPDWYQSEPMMLHAWLHVTVSSIMWLVEC